QIVTTQKLAGREPAARALGSPQLLHARRRALATPRDFVPKLPGQRPGAELVQMAGCTGRLHFSADWPDFRFEDKISARTHCGPRTVGQPQLADIVSEWLKFTGQICLTLFSALYKIKQFGQVNFGIPDP